MIIFSPARATDGFLILEHKLHCECNCCYCLFRAGRTCTEPITFSPDDMAHATDALARAGKITGIIKGSVTKQEKVIPLETAFFYFTGETMR